MYCSTQRTLKALIHNDKSWSYTPPPPPTHPATSIILLVRALHGEIDPALLLFASHSFFFNKSCTFSCSITSMCSKTDSQCYTYNILTVLHIQQTHSVTHTVQQTLSVGCLWMHKLYFIFHTVIVSLFLWCSETSTFLSSAWWCSSHINTLIPHPTPPALKHRGHSLCHCCSTKCLCPPGSYTVYLLFQ